MNNLQSTTDKMAISLSALCAIHCLVLPLLVVSLPSLSALPLQDEMFHIWMVVAVIPISIYALTMGCKKHKNYTMLFIGVLGLAILAVAAFMGHDLLGHELEKVFTVIGAFIIAAVHVWNYRLCQRREECCNSESIS